MGSLISVLLAHSFKKYGKDYHNLKGSFFGLFVWATLYSLGQKLGFYSYEPKSTKSGYSAIWHHLLYGIVSSNVILHFAEPNLFPSKENYVEQP